MRQVMKIFMKILTGIKPYCYLSTLSKLIYNVKSIVYYEKNKL